MVISVGILGYLRWRSGPHAPTLWACTVTMVTGCCRVTSNPNKQSNDNIAVGCIYVSWWVSTHWNNSPLPFFHCYKNTQKMKMAFVQSLHFLKKLKGRCLLLSTQAEAACGYAIVNFTLLGVSFTPLTEWFSQCLTSHVKVQYIQNANFCSVFRETAAKVLLMFICFKLHDSKL